MKKILFLIIAITFFGCERPQKIDWDKVLGGSDSDSEVTDADSGNTGNTGNTGDTGDTGNSGDADSDEVVISDLDEIQNDADILIDDSLNDESQADDSADNDSQLADDDFQFHDADTHDADTHDADTHDADTYDADTHDADIPDENTTTDHDNVLPDIDGNQPDEIVAPDEDQSDFTVTIGTYNLENFFDTECDRGTDAYGDCYDFFVLTPSEFNSKLSATAASIRSIASDIQIIVEIEDYTSGNALLTELSDIYDDVYIAIKSSGSQNLGVLTKGTVTNVINHGYETDFAREFPEIHISYLGKSIIVFPAHFKAKSNDDPARRLREATKAAEIINEVALSNPNSLIVLGGDLNDFPGSDPLNALDSADLLRTASDISANEQCTYNYNGCSKIDHIYLSLEGAGEYIPKSAKVIKDGGCGSGPYCLGDSDHAALKASFRIGKPVIVDPDPDPETVSIYDIKRKIIAENVEVKTKGVVTAVDGNSFFIQTLPAEYDSILKEKYSAVFVYISSSSSPSFSIPVIGDVVEVEGTTKVYFGEVEIDSVTDVKTTGTASLPGFLVVSPYSVQADEYEGVLVNVGSVTVSSIGSFGDFVVTGELYVDDDMYSISPSVGDSYSLKGVMKYSHNEYRLLPRSSSDVKLN